MPGWDELLWSFQSEAAERGLCYLSRNGIGPDVPVFNFYYNMGDIYTGVDPQALFDLVMFAREHAKKIGANKYVEKSAYGLLTHVAPTACLNLQKDFVVWDDYPYDRDDPKYLSLEDWLEMHGFIVPKV